MVRPYYLTTARGLKHTNLWKDCVSRMLLCGHTRVSAIGPEKQSGGLSAVQESSHTEVGDGLIYAVLLEYHVDNADHS